MIKKVLSAIARNMGFNSLQSLEDVLIYQEQRNRKNNHSNSFVRYGKKCFSQTDEDGLTLEIIRRLGISEGRFIEFGVGDGMENNTLVLLAADWKGTWFGGQDLAFSTDKSEKLHFEKVWITKDNIVDLCKSASAQKPDLISLDLDGNDYHLVKTILENDIHPDIFIVEYHAKFIPPTEFVMAYKAYHMWAGNDYFGASLASYNKLFEQFDYSLVCCNSDSGANAFFIKKDRMKLFPEVPPKIEDIYCAPYYFRPKKFGHQQSVKTIEQIINH